MKINELFAKSVSRSIDGVIKADDTRHRKAELEEYVVTRDVARGLGILTERYLNEATANGVWISGFYGSGKSHLLKILSMVLDKELVEDIRPADIILPKIEDEIVRADLQRCAAIPSQSILFNIDQKFDNIGGNHEAGILEVFVKVLNDLEGYYGKQGYIAKFERDMDARGEWSQFKETYQRLNDISWEIDREALATTSKANFARAYAEHFGAPESEAFNLMRQVREDYRVSIESFADMVKSYIDKQEPHFRLNFFVDEVGQFIGSDSNRMLNLQTITETLATVCGGNAWVFVTSQADIEGVLGTFKGMGAQDISKIQGRFKTRLTLASADVHEVIQKRLLAKKQAEPEVLTDIYDHEKDNLATLFRFGDGSLNLGGWKSSAEFCDYYPVHNYQFDLFQKAIEQLSIHGMFTGKHTSVGERSMLSVFQEVVKNICGKEVGALASFDLMYDSIAPTIRGNMQTGIKTAERNLNDRPIAVRILKALFLLKWVREFKATPRNVAILLIDRVDIDIAAHEKAVEEALSLLENQSYLQRNGEVYEFLTDIEKDVEQEIKNVAIDDSEVMRKLGDILFTDILRDPKIRYEENDQYYSYTRKLDDQPFGRASNENDLAINLITTEHPHHDAATMLAQQNTGKAELLAILPDDTRLVDGVRIFLKTQKYVQQNRGGNDANRQAVLDRREQQNNSERLAEITNWATDSLSKAAFFLNNQKLDAFGESDPRARFHKAAQELISFAFPSLGKLKGSYNENMLSQAMSRQDDLLHEPDEAENEIIIAVTRKQSNKERISADELINSFSRRPYGWYPMATLTLIARLYRARKLDLQVSGESLSPQDALEFLKNSRKRGGVNVCPQQHFDNAKIEALKKFHRDFFDTANTGTDPRGIGQCTAEAFAAAFRQITTLLHETSNYPFLEALRPLAQLLEKLAQRDYAYFLDNLADFEDDALTLRDDVWAPIQAFMNGSQRETYDAVMSFLREEEANFPEISSSSLQPLRDLAQATHPYRGNLVPAAKAALTKLRQQLQLLLAEARKGALAQVQAKRESLQSTENFAALTGQQQQKVLLPSDAAIADIQAARFVTLIRDRLLRYKEQDFPAQLNDLHSEAAVSQSGDAQAVSSPPAPSRPFTPASRLRPQCNAEYISNEATLDEWLSALRQAALAELEKGNFISL